MAAEDFGKVFSDGRRNMTHTPDIQPAQAKAKGAAGDVQLLLCRCTTRCSTCTTAARSFRNKIEGSTITGRRLRLARQHTELAEVCCLVGRHLSPGEVLPHCLRVVTPHQTTALALLSKGDAYMLLHY